MKLPENQKDLEVLKEFVNKYHTHEWLRGANIIENHPTRMCKTLEVCVNYRPVRLMSELMDFAHKYTLALEFVTVDRQ